MRLGLSHLARMEQRLVQSPQMIQAMQILQLSRLDLAERLEQELVENPFLEVDETSRETPEAPPEGEVLSDRDRLALELERLREFEEVPKKRQLDHEASDRKQEAMQNTPARPKSTAQVLVDQLPMLDLEGPEREAAEFLIYSLDPHGYLEDTLEDLAVRWAGDRSSNGSSVDPATALHDLRTVLGRMRRAIHPALGAHDLGESLRLQLEARGVTDDLVYELVENHLDDLEKNRLPHIAKETGATLDEIKDALGVLRGLDPHPTADYGEEQAEAILPDVVVTERDGEYEVRLSRQGMPTLRLVPDHRAIIKEAVAGSNETTEAKDWLRKRLESARWFVDAVAQRQSTLLSVAKAIFERQSAFLERGVKALAPLRMQDVADATSVHISTVSRAVSGKYAETPRGIFPLKFFFNSGTTDTTGRATSQVSIQQRLKELVDGEDASEPLSDDQLAALLLERHGVKIARRTVTKYRKALQIPPSGQRKQF
ncbi:MAG: RNA polymerase factor sigma-54 [Planctomycetota bacterium]